jgi:hypothetical protein
MGRARNGRPGRGMKWRVMVELTGGDGIVRLQEAPAGGTNASECSAGTVGLMLADGKRTLAGLQDQFQIRPRISRLPARRSWRAAASRSRMVRSHTLCLLGPLHGL